MKFESVLLTIVFAVCLLAGVAWFGQSASLDVNEPPTVPPKPEISSSGPHPKAVVAEKEFEFGVMAVGEKLSHTFVIHNRGEAPLILQKPTSTCKCTVGELAKPEIPVGESVEVKMTWKGLQVNENFRETATIATNDPEYRKIKLSIKGQVQDRLVMTPPDHWQLGAITGNDPITVTGTLISPLLDEFKILGIESTTDKLTGESELLSEDELKELKAKFGYRIRATMQADIPVGVFLHDLTIKTDVGEGAEFVVRVTGRREGPLRFVAMAPARWRGDLMTVSLGRFAADKGGKATLWLFVNELIEDQELEVSEIKTDPEYLRVAVKPDSNFAAGNSKRYFVTVEVPAGRPPVSLRGESAGTVTLKTNHPKAPTLKFRVQFVTF